MRFVVLFFGFIGCLLTGAAGCILVFLEVMRPIMQREYDIILPDELGTNLTGMSLVDAGLFLWIAAAYGFLGTLMGFMCRGKQAGVLMLLPALGAGLMNPYTLVFTSLQCLTGFAAFFVSPLTITPPEQKDEDTDED
ncbi:MAG: hypothetical protein EXR98_13695 [Gemmataceae bacterium]|nr:hypothetical protein [Gemmataceae bacterium]